MISKIFDKIVIVIVVVLFIVGFREMILTDDLAGSAFGELIGMLPFAKELADPISSILKCQYEVPIISNASVIESLLRLSIMACIQPLVMWLLTKVFLPLPGYLKHSYDMEAYMNSFSYKLKELLINIIFCPLLAIGAAWLSTYAVNFLTSSLGSVGGIIASLGGIIAGLGLSTIPLVVIGGKTLGFAIIWRLLVTVLPKMLEVFVTGTLCVAIYVAAVGGVQSQIIWSVIWLILWLVISGFGIKLIMRSLAGASL